MSKLQQLKQEISELTTKQILSIFLQLFCISFSLAAIYWYQTGTIFEETMSRNELDHFILVIFGLVGYLFFKDLGK